MGDQLLGHDVVETNDAVRITFAVVSLTGDQACPGNPSMPVTVVLGGPLGDQELREGSDGRGALGPR